MYLFLKLLLFIMLVGSLVGCSLSKKDKNILATKLRGSNETYVKLKNIQDTKYCKTYFSEYKKTFKEEELFRILSEKDYYSIFKAECLVASNYPESIISLINKITDSTEVGLEGFFPVIIMDRVENGDMEVMDYGDVTNDDLFRVSGRCNYILKDLTGQDFGFAEMNNTKNDLVELQNKWINWVLSL